MFSDDIKKFLGKYKVVYNRDDYEVAESMAVQCEDGRFFEQDIKDCKETIGTRILRYNAKMGASLNKTLKGMGLYRWTILTQLTKKQSKA